MENACLSELFLFQVLRDYKLHCLKLLGDHLDKCIKFPYYATLKVTNSVGLLQ